jgi:squalene-hopene/tetraprenyl-beta-curcumene cyclase
MNSFPVCLRLFVCAVALACCEESIAAEADGAANVREVIKRSIPFIEREGADWIASKGCVSCHHTAFTVWSLSAAKQKGIHVDEAQLDEWRNLIADWQNLLAPTVRAAAKQEVTMPANPDTVAQILLARRPWHADAVASPWVIEYENGLLAGQQADGSWTPGGQLPLQKRPKRETQEVTTMWAMLVVADSNLPNAAKAAALEKARSWLGEATVGKSTEWWATRTMLEKRIGKSEKADSYRQELLKRQRPDGGWGWLCDDESDALGTGIALFSLADMKDQSASAAIGNARRFLAQSQAKDGSWPTHGTKDNKKNRIEPTATYWATCWAVIGLCATLDE